MHGLPAGVEFAGSETTAAVMEFHLDGCIGCMITYGHADSPSTMDEIASMDGAGVTTSYSYDANENLDVKTSGRDYDWNFESHMTVAKLNGVPQQSYTYDGLGRRVKVDGVSGSGAWTVSIVSGMDAIFETTNTGASRSTSTRTGCGSRRSTRTTRSTTFSPTTSGRRGRSSTRTGTRCSSQSTSRSGTRTP